MKRIVFLLSAGFFGFLTASAATGLESGTKFGTGEDSIRCLENLSIFNANYKNKDYETAYEAWKVVYAECPTAGGRTLYSQGVNMLIHKMSKATDAAQKKQFFDEMMACYDQRIQYFGHETKYPKAYILGRKAIDYLNYSGDPNAAAVALPWLKESIDGRGVESDADVVNTYFSLLEKDYQADKDGKRTSFIEEYLRLSKWAAERAERKDAQGNPDKTAEQFAQVASNLNVFFTNSGAADCATLEQVFAAKVDEQKDNADALATILRLFRKAGCKESDVYFKASLYAHRLNPTAETAAGCGYQAMKQNNLNDAANFFLEAVSRADNNADRYDYQYNVAVVYQKLNRFSDARSAAYKALEFESAHGEPYILIAYMYANSKPYPDDPILNKTIYWAAVDKLEKAKAVDPACASTAQQLINTYRQHYPSKQDVFFKPELQLGETFTIGGWIGESVKCRD
ncbi:MAG: hypothetical protein J6Z12_03850 [Paludibacteraceae bacterium]|nr:hypothetical protein [Paludibacteraceae bacterium]